MSERLILIILKLYSRSKFSSSSALQLYYSTVHEQLWSLRSDQMMNNDFELICLNDFVQFYNVFITCHRRHYCHHPNFK